jgi:hypothetical protein
MTLLMQTLMLMETSTYIVRLPHIWLNQNLNYLMYMSYSHSATSSMILWKSLNPSLVEDIYLVNNFDVRSSPQDYNLLRPFFAWAPADTIQKTLGVSTQYTRGRVSGTLRQHWKCRFPACKVRRRNEAVATDTIFSDTPSGDSGVKAAQLFIGRSSMVADVYGVKTDKEFVRTKILLRIVMPPSRLLPTVF